MSFSNAPDEATLGQVAGALAVDEAFVEKDWYVVQAIAYGCRNLRRPCFLLVPNGELDETPTTAAKSR